MNELPETGGEGFVLRLEDGTRVKYKAEWYRRIEETMNRTTELTIWDALRNGRSLDDLLTDAPPAFEAWAEDVAARLRADFRAIEQDSRAAVDRGAPKEARRPEIAYKIAAGRPYADRLWRLLRPRSPGRFRPQVDQPAGAGPNKTL